MPRMLHLIMIVRIQGGHVGDTSLLGCPRVAGCRVQMSTLRRLGQPPGQCMLSAPAPHHEDIDLNTGVVI